MPALDKMEHSPSALQGLLQGGSKGAGWEELGQGTATRDLLIKLPS